MLKIISKRNYSNELRRVRDIGIVTMGPGHSITEELMQNVNTQLDQVVNDESMTACILTAECLEKIWNWGIDPAWGHVVGPERTVKCFHEITNLCGRLLSFPVPVIAQINGHVIGGGSLLALACDYRIQRSERMFFNLDAIDRNMSFSLPLSQLVRLKLSPQVLRDMVLRTVKPSSKQSLEWGIVDEIHKKNEIDDATVAAAEKWGKKNRLAYKIMKEELYKQEIELMYKDDIYHEPFDPEHEFYLFKGTKWDQDANN